MASLTVRKLDESLKTLLRLRAARHGRSMEDEVRTILREAAEGAGRQAIETVDPQAPIVSARVQTTASRRVTPAPALGNRHILLVIGGGIAAYKSLDLIRRLRERGAAVRCILTRAAQEFVTKLAAGALANAVFTDLFDPQSEFDVGHIRLAREADLIVVAPATADLMAKMAGGHADDHATAVLLAADSPILLAPAMNPHMWARAATRRNVARLAADGITFVGPSAGEMAESGEAGTGRMAEPLEIVAAAEALLAPSEQPLAGTRVLVTSGPTHEPIDPVRYIGNRSSGRQGHAIAAAAAQAGADVVLVSGPVAIDDPPGVSVVKVESAQQMLEAVEGALPVDVAVFAAAVADWRVAQAGQQKLKKGSGGPPTFTMVENPDILATVARLPAKRPKLVIGFAAETSNVVDNAKVKLRQKGCDWILANDVSPQSGVFGGDSNTIHLVTAGGVESWPTQTKEEVAATLVARIAAELNEPQS
jgi:phosphopantothenoylcysteine decarboxylase/phosphopantothenate--cysteine ligase